MAIEQFIDNEVKGNDVVLFMKGTPQFPMCGFSGQVVQILDYLGVPYKGLNVLENEDLRNGIKTYSNWPTIPQLYVKGEFVGGCDIIREMFQAGELQSLMKEKGLPVKDSAPASQPLSAVDRAGPHRVRRGRCAGRLRSAQPLHHQIDDRDDHGEADQARRRHRARELHHVVGDRFDEHARAVAEDQVDQDHRQDRQESQFDEQPKKASGFFEDLHHPAPPMFMGWGAPAPHRA